MNHYIRPLFTLCLALLLGACGAPGPEPARLPATSTPPLALSLRQARESRPKPRAVTATPALATATPAPVMPPEPPAAAPPERMVIESIGLDRTLVKVGLGPNAVPIVPDHDLAWFEHSARPGAGENIVVWGHALRFRATPEIPAPLELMHNTRVGDRITIVAADGTTYPYTISEQVWALPSQVEYILPSGREQLTIVNCIGAQIINAAGQLDTEYRLITVARPIH